jgi:hypothetical protein
MWLRTIKFIAKTSKCAGLAQEIGFSALKIVQLPMAGKRRNTFVRLKKRV